MKSLRVNKKWVNDFEKAQTCIEDLEVLFDFFKDGESSVEEVEKQFNLASVFLEDIEFKNMLSEEGDSLSAVLQITAGAGGTESCDWASMLMRMYMMWGEKKGCKITELNFQEGDVAGVKTVTLEFEGEFAFGCTDPNFSEYDNGAEIDDGSCVSLFGCIDDSACNFNPEAIADNGLCIYNDADDDGICDDQDDCIGQVDACGICNGPGEVYECGCFDLPSEPIWCSCGDIPEGDCDCDGNQLDALGICGGWCEADANGDGICDCVEADPEGACGCELYEDDLGDCGGNVFYGCTYAFAVNFDVDATVDDGSCALSGCTHPMAINYNPLAEIEDASCLFGGCTDSVAINYGVDAGSLGYVFTEIEHDVPYPLDYGIGFNQVLDDWLSEPVLMDWEFELFGVAYAQFQVSSNGYLFFDDGAVSSGYSPWSINDQLPSDGLPFPAIFAVYNDMDPSTCGTIHYGIDGESPQRKWVVSWNELCVFGSGGTCQDQFVSAQLVLHETSNAIEFHVVNRASCSGWNDDALIIGLQNENATVAHAAPGYNNENPVVSELSWLAVPVGSQDPNFDDGSCLYAGCMDPLACNFQPDAIENDDTFVFLSKLPAVQKN